jgi:hypothetical protein
VADPAVGDPATATPSYNVFQFCLGRNEKRGVLAPQIRFENRFLIVIAALSTNRHPLSNFLDPPLRTAYQYFNSISIDIAKPLIFQIN